MRSSVCKYVLDKVSKFEKKYSSPLQKGNKKDNNLQFKDNIDDDASSKSIENEIEAIKTKSVSHSHINQELSHTKNESLEGFKSFRSDIMGASKVDLLASSNQGGCKVEQNKKITIMQKHSNKESNIASDSKYKCDGQPDINFFSDSDESLLAKDIEYRHTLRDFNKSLAYTVDKDLPIYTEDTLKEDPISIEEKKIDSNVLGNPYMSIDIHEGNNMVGRLQMSLNLKLDEDTDDVSDMSSKGIASLSLENSNSSQNIPLNIFAFEDLIASEEFKSNREELKDNIREENELEEHSHKEVHNAGMNSLLIADDLFLNPETSSDKILINASDEDDIEEILTSRESTDELSIKEDIEGEIETSVDENCNEFSEQIQISSEKIMHSLEVDSNAIDANRAESSGPESENVPKSVQFRDNISSYESIPVCVYDDVNESISSQESKPDVIHQEEENGDKQLIRYQYNPKDTCKKKKNFEQDLKLTQDKHNKLKPKSHDYIKNVKKVHKREKYFQNNLKLYKSKHNNQDELCHMSTQTENFVAETYDFEKRMETILKSSFNSMADASNLPLEDQVFGGQTSYSATTSSPLERGFHCALKQQLELTKHFVHAEYNMYAVCMAAIKEMSATYKPATLHYHKRVQKPQS